MGSSISKIYDDYDDYKALCDHLGIHHNIRSAVYGSTGNNCKTFYEHAKALIADPQYKDKIEEIKESYLYHKFK